MQQQAGSDIKAHVTLAEKVVHLRSRGFLIDNCDAIDNAFPDFIDLLYEYQNIFSYTATDTTECNLLECEIMTYPGARPVRCRPYRLNDEVRGHMNKQLNELLEAGVITEDNGSPFASPVIMVKKKSGEFRFAVDMRHLNRISLPLFHELPVFEDILDVMTRNKAQVLSTLDLRQVYHQPPLTEQSSRITTFITPHGGPSDLRGFHRVISKVLSECRWL